MIIGLLFGIWTYLVVVSILGNSELHVCRYCNTRWRYITKGAVKHETLPYKRYLPMIWQDKTNVQSEISDANWATYSEIPTRKSAVCIPCVAIFVNSLSGQNDSVFVIAIALLLWNTFLVFVHVSSLSAAAAIHWCESGLARVVSVAKWLASAIARGHVVAIDRAFRARCTVFAWRGNLNVR